MCQLYSPGRPCEWPLIRTKRIRQGSIRGSPSHEHGRSGRCASQPDIDPRFGFLSKAPLDDREVSWEGRDDQAGQARLSAGGRAGLVRRGLSPPVPHGD
jgi:hypothetical protein